MFRKAWKGRAAPALWGLARSVHVDLVIPFHIPRDTYNGRGAGKVFQMKNSASRFVALNKPETLNALDVDMIRDLTEIYKEAANDDMCKLLFVYGASDRAFCAGGGSS
jgi:hypothetical protein